MLSDATTPLGQSKFEIGSGKWKILFFYAFLTNRQNKLGQNKLGLSCAKLSTAWASYTLAVNYVFS